MIITAIIENKKHYFTGGVSKQLPLFSKDKAHAKYYNQSDAESNLQRIKNLSVLGKIYEHITNPQIEKQ